MPTTGVPGWLRWRSVRLVIKGHGFEPHIKCGDYFNKYNLKKTETPTAKLPPLKHPIRPCREGSEECKLHGRRRNDPIFLDYLNFTVNWTPVFKTSGLCG